MADSMSQLMKTFNEGFAALDKAKQDDPDQDPPKQTMAKVPSKPAVVKDKVVVKTTKPAQKQGKEKPN
jgi:hypothetical protein